MLDLDQLLLARSTGDIGPNAFARFQCTRLLKSLQWAQHIAFDGGERAATGGSNQGLSSVSSTARCAHQAGVSALALERFDGRLLASGGSDGCIRLWDLEQSPNPTTAHTFLPTAQARRFDDGTNPHHHRFGITHLSFFPFDPDALLSSSYDQTLKLWATQGARPSGSFSLGAKVYTHAISPIASHLLVACGTQHPAVRLVDLRTSAAVQSLISPGQMGGAAGANLAVAWSPVHEHVLLSGSVDGAVRIWDVRRASGLVGLLDQEDSVGMALTGTAGGERPPIRTSARAHNGAVNGLAWTDDGNLIISTGHDNKIRVWDAATGANTLASFGPHVRNAQVVSHDLFATPTGLMAPGTELLFYPNESEILVLDLHQGATIARLRWAAVPKNGARRGGASSERVVRNRVTSLAWRGSGGGGSSSGVVPGGRSAGAGMYSGHLDGQVRAWLPHLEGLDEEGEGDEDINVPDERTKKRKAVDEAFRSLMGKGKLVKKDSLQGH